MLDRGLLSLAGMTVRDSDGFTLIEVMVAISLLATAASALLSLTLVADRANVSARRAGVAQAIAREKMEQLRALAWTSDGAIPVSDWSSDLTHDPPRDDGGPGLGLSPGDTLSASVNGYADFLDADGRWLGGGTTAPRNSVWLRRWSVQAMPSPADTLLFQVIVVPARTSDSPASLAAARAVNGAWLIGMRTRSAR
jgi:prepilin-type N-terminal cleavage/methylation domain-containing protein